MLRIIVPVCLMEAGDHMNKGLIKKRTALILSAVFMVTVIVTLIVVNRINEYSDDSVRDSSERTTDVIAGVSTSEKATHPTTVVGSAKTTERIVTATTTTGETATMATLVLDVTTGEWTTRDTTDVTTGATATESTTKGQTTEDITKATTQETTKATTEATTKATITEATTKATTQETTRATTEATTKTTTEVQTTEATTIATTEVITKATTEATTETTTEAATKSTAEKDTQSTTEAATKHTHTWVWKTHIETVHHDAVTHTEYIYNDGWTEYIYSDSEKIFCDACGKQYESIDDYIANDLCGGSYHGNKVLEYTIEHEPEIIDSYEYIDVPAYDEEVEVKDYQYCSECGQNK